MLKKLRLIILLLLLAGLSGEAIAAGYNYLENGALVPAQAGWVIPGIMESDKYRVRACLNGLWEFAPSHEATSLKEFLNLNPQWQPLKVPSWYGAGWTSVIKGGDAKGSPFGWYRVQFILPAAWKGKHCCLLFEGLAYGANIYLNDKLLSTRNWYYRAPLYVDITDSLHFGTEKNTLYVFLTAYGHEIEKDGSGVKPIGTWTKGSEEFIKKAYASRLRLYQRNQGELGLFRDVWLEVYPGINAGDIFIIPSVRKKRLKIEAQIRNETGKEEKVEVINQVWDKDRLVKEGKGGTVILQEGESRDMELVIPWPDPRCWSPEDPYLYTLKTVIKKGRETVDIKSTTFGFREFWVEGGNFYLNGKRTYLRSQFIMAVARDTEDLSLVTPEYMEAAIKLLKDSGYNFYRQHVIDESFPQYGYDLFDRIGVMVGCGVPGFNASTRSVLSAIHKGEVEFNKHPVKEDCIATIKFLRNHPSIVIWEASNEVIGYSAEDIPEYAEVLRRLDEEAIIPIDPTRPVVHHQDGYLEFSPIVCAGPVAFTAEEYEDVASLAASDPEKAYMMHEPGIMPWRPIYGRGYDKIETTAMVVGPEAYRARLDVGPVPEIDRTLSQYIKNTYRAWRWHGVDSPGSFAVFERLFDTPYEKGPGEVLKGKPLNTPGAKPDGIPQWKYHILNPGWDPAAPFIKPTPGYYALKEAFSPLLVYIGGEEASPTSRDHAYFSGEEISKSIIAINDRLDEVNLHITWQVTDKIGKSFTSGKNPIRISPGERVCKPLVLIAPKVKARKQFFIILEAYLQDKKLVSKDKFSFEVFPRFRKGERLEGIGLYDKKGSTSEALKRLGIKCTPISIIDQLTPSKFNLLIIGRESLKKEVFTDSLIEFLSKGRSVLIFEQTDISSYPPGLRVSLVKHRRRQAFITAFDHPVFEGLKDKDLYYWRGESDLIKPTHEFTQPTRDYYAMLRSASPFKFGAKGMVNSYGISKPLEGNFSCLLSNGKDLNYSPLVEYRFGKGKLLLCQLDITDRIGMDPAATHLLNNILQYLSSATPAKDKEVFYLGEEEQAKFLSDLDISFHQSRSAEDLEKAEVIILGNKIEQDWFNKSLITKLAKEGRQILILPQEENSNLLACLPWDLGIGEPRNFAQAILLRPDDSLLQGICNAEFDFYSPANQKKIKLCKEFPKEALILTEPPVLFKIPYGQGEFIFVQLPKELLQLRKGTRFFLTLLTNLGIRTQKSIHLAGLKPLKEGVLFTADLRNCCNMGFEDDEAGNQKGGWTDQGPGNSLVGFPVGEQKFLGIPFDIIDPMKNQGKSCIVLYGTPRPYFPEEVRGITITQKVERLHFLVSSAWTPKEEVETAKFLINYADNSQIAIPLIANVNVADWWGPSPVPEAKIAWEGAKPRCVNIHLYIWQNPYPQREILFLDFVSSKSSGIPILIAVTGEECVSVSADRYPEAQLSFCKIHKLDFPQTIKPSSNIAVEVEYEFSPALPCESVEMFFLYFHHEQAKILYREKIGVPIGTEKKKISIDIPREFPLRKSKITFCFAAPVGVEIPDAEKLPESLFIDYEDTLIGRYVIPGSKIIIPVYVKD